MSKTLTIYLAADVRKLSSGLRNGQQDLKGFAGHVDRLGSTLTGMLGPAMIGAGIAAGAMATKFALDGVQAFIADDAAAAKLATTLDNLGLAHDTTAVETMIDALQRETGVADDALRPAFGRLAVSIGDTKLATEALKLAMDVSAGTGKSLDSVVQALGKAYDGNTAGLSKLGAGIDKGVLATGNMQAITKSLADTFGGQAQTAAATYQGKLDRLAIGFDELKESFGKGFISGLEGADDKAGDLITTLANLEPKMEKLGAATFDAGVALVDAGTAMLDFKSNVETAADFAVARFSISLIHNADALGLISDEAGAAAEAEYQLYLATNNLVGQMDPAARSAYALQLRYQALAASALAAANATSTGIDQQAVQTSRWTGLAKSLDATIKTTGGNLKEYFAELKNGSGTTSTATTANDLLTEAYDRQDKKLADTTDRLKDRSDALVKASQDIADYSQGITDAILGNIDLGQASETGAELGTSTLQAFDDQIAQATWFGNVLQSIKASGADQKLTDELASLGPAVGGKLAQEMIDKGLIQTFSDKIVEVTAAAKGMGDAMVPELMLAGEEMAAGAVIKMVEKFESQKATLVKLGKAIGKPIGENIKAEILQSVAEALEKAETVKSAAGARRAAERATEQAAATPQQLAQLVAQVISTSNARTGYSMGVPIPSPVLG